MADQETPVCYHSEDCPCYNAGVNWGVADTKAKYAPWEHLVGENNDWRQKLADERTNGAALLAVARNLSTYLAEKAHLLPQGDSGTFSERTPLALRDRLVTALAAHNASQGPEEESHVIS